MKTRSVANRLIVPTAVILVLLPVLSCLVFYEGARQYAFDEAVRSLESLQNRIAPIMERSFGDMTENSRIAGEDAADPVKQFLSEAGPVASRMDGDCRLMVLAGGMQVVYPRDEGQRAIVAPLARQFSDALEKGSLPVDGSASLYDTATEGTYLLSAYKVPFDSQRIKYVIAYCPASRIGEWVPRATLIVLAVSAVGSICIVAALWFAARNIAKSLRRLSDGAERMGEGQYDHVEPAFRLTELEAMRTSMNQMADRLRRSDESQKSFLQNTSHELRNPLMSISGYAQGIEQGVFDPVPAAHTILDESQRLTDVVNGLLALSRLEGDVEHMKISDVNVVECVSDCLRRIGGLAAKEGVVLAFDAADDVAAFGNEELLAQVLDNLLSNAARFARARVEVGVMRQGDRVKVIVADDGPGIGEADLPHVFERCYKGEGGNYGIGLAIARTAAEAMGADLAAANSPQGGAVFTLSLHAA